MKQSLVWTLMLGTLISAPSYAFLNFGNSNDDLASMVSNTLNQAESNSSLISQVTSQLPVSGQQATGGVGALLSLAQNQLSESNSEELTKLIPGMDQLTSLNLSGSSGSTDILSSIQNMESVNKVFEQLGLDSGMVSQFAPVLLQYLTGQGASDGLLSSLSSLWGA
ncbi:DUF2780 domain-containing protein [Vibrio furnissii]|uniref:DUF2780 domain-containing protein n=1 Tax=Vibrio furnissii TaxID=29494 RepID=UPI001E645183|nr:DUF2780 domain-containing protein [Vibrio furnissii]UHJ59948.1 DUF2780 domain-containing protein [Vibrio furnissii]